MNEIVSEELDAVRAILMDGIEVWDDGKGGITTIIISLHPLTANEDERSYVSLTLEIAISAGYPDVAPDVAVSVPCFAQYYRNRTLVCCICPVAQARKAYIRLNNRNL